MLMCIMAYPDEEARRLEKLVSALPLNTHSPLDGKLERLARQISRYLFPEGPDRNSRVILDKVMKELMYGVFPDQRRPSTATARPPPISSSRDARPPDTTSPRMRYAPTSGGRDDRSHNGHDRRPSTSRDSHARMQESDTQSSRGPSGRTSSTSGPRPQLQMPPPPVGRNSGSSRNRSPQGKGYRASNPEVHNASLHGANASPSSSSIGQFKSSALNLPPTSEHVTTSRDHRDKEDREYMIYGSPRDSRHSVDSTPRRPSSVMNLDDAEEYDRPERGSKAGRRLSTASSVRGEPWNEYSNSLDGPSSTMRRSSSTRGPSHR